MRLLLPAKAVRWWWVLVQDEFFLASDATPIVEYTDKVVYLEDGEIAVIHRGKRTEGGRISSNVEMTPEVKKVELESRPAGKGRLSAFHVEGDF